MHYSSAIVFILLSLYALTALGGRDCSSEVPIPPCGVKRSYNGECNNPVFTQYGKAGNYLMRGAEGVWYADGVRQPILTPNLRTVSNELFRADEAKRQEDGLNLLWTFFGQFVTHDLMGVHRKGDNIVDLSQPSNNSNIFVLVPLEQSNDAFYTVAIPPITVPYLRVLRSRGDFVNGVFQVGSESTSFLDLDTVYGKEEVVANLLRKYSGGELMSRVYNNYTAIQGVGLGAGTIPANLVGNYGEWLPLVADVDPNRTHIPISPQLVPEITQNITLRFFASGDGRNGENYGLNTLHGLFVREHNRIARATAAAHPGWNDEQIFQYARNLNIAQYQAIVMYEYLPSLLGADYNQIGSYDGYNMFTDPQASQLFAFSFRFGHSTVPDSYSLRNRCGGPAYNSSRDGPRTSQAAFIFMPPDQMAENGKPENVLHALMFEGTREIDLQFPEQLRTIGFGANTDVTVQNLLRAADNGIPDFHTVRKLWHGGDNANIYGTPDCPATETSPAPDPMGCWLQLTANTTAASRMQTLFGKLNRINFYAGVLAEDPSRAAVGQTSARIIADQFKRSRDGDRWWFENEGNGLFTKQEARNLKRDMTMAVLLRRNFDANVADDAFYVPKSRFFRNCVP